MKTNPDPNDTLLEAVLGDDAWQAANAVGKAKAMSAFHTGQRVRRVIRWSGALAVLAVLGAMLWAFLPPRQGPQRFALSAAPEPAPTSAKYLTDDEFLALFPPGSCFIAEVDGEKKLIFFDPEVERQYVSDGSHPGLLTMNR